MQHILIILLLIIIANSNDTINDSNNDNNTANLHTSIMDCRGFDSSIISILRGGTFMPIGDFPESSSRGILVGIMLVRRLGVIPQY